MALLKNSPNLKQVPFSPRNEIASSSVVSTKSASFRCRKKDALKPVDKTQHPEFKEPIRV